MVLDPQAEDGARAKIVADARAAIEAAGELLRHDDWGERPLTYPIRRRASGEYHLLQFHPADSALLLVSQSLIFGLAVLPALLFWQFVLSKSRKKTSPPLTRTAQCRLLIMALAGRRLH